MTRVRLAAVTIPIIGLAILWFLFFHQHAADDSQTIVKADSSPTLVAVDNSPLLEAIEKGVRFIRSNQSVSGEFNSQLCIKDKCENDNNYFTTISILLLLKEIRPNAVWDNSHANAISFIKQGMNAESLWRFWTDKITPPDVDDTALASFLLLDENISLPNKAAIIANRSPEGLFYTWIHDDADNPKYNDIDMVINSNVILYLNHDPYHKDICDNANKLIAEHKEMDNIWYYPHLLDFYFAISRVHKHKPCLLAKSIKEILKSVDSIKSTINTNEFANDPSQLAKAVHVILDLDHKNTATIDFFLNRLKGMQRLDGGFSSGIFFLGPPPPTPRISSWKSESLATAYVISAMSKSIRLEANGYSE
jgi:hypothetical protein